ncbi:hypothetical protein [Actinomadura sp. DC4]|uniref:hypothetical protein n=1 Tax=Actinomadura sp. DC4 TaxID=3055069 RepID=UPI0025B0AC2A|nr:hypothetical protein [Actinomadura sp. DC4]MDN3356922.1 hypothetical protein [Actinomadura sp. DC4]
MRGAVVTAAASALVTGGCAASSPTSALASSERQAHRASWHDTGQSFYWYASCEAAGKAGMASGWQAFDCKGSSAPWSSYELWGLY